MVLITSSPLSGGSLPNLLLVDIELSNVLISIPSFVEHFKIKYHVALSLNFNSKSHGQLVVADYKVLRDIRKQLFWVGMISFLIKFSRIMSICEYNIMVI